MQQHKNSRLFEKNNKQFLKGLTVIGLYLQNKPENQLTVWKNNWQFLQGLTDVGLYAISMKTTGCLDKKNIRMRPDFHGARIIIIMLFSCKFYVAKYIPNDTARRQNITDTHVARFYVLFVLLIFFSQTIFDYTLCTQFMINVLAQVLRTLAIDISTFSNVRSLKLT